MAAFAVIAMALVAGCGSETSKQTAIYSIAVGIAPVRYCELAQPIHTSGMLHASSEMRLSFKVSGIVDKITVDEGSFVKPGQLLAQLRLTEIEAMFNRAHSAYAKAERDMKRVQDLFADSVATLEQKQDAETGLVAARSNLEIAEFNLNHATIRAPSAGRILKRFVEPNELVQAGTPILAFGSEDQGWIVRSGVTDRDLLRLELGDSAIVSFDAYPDSFFPACVAEIAEAVDPASGAFEVELSIDKTNRKLVSGFVAGVDIFPRQTRGYFVVPIEALVEADGMRGFVYEVVLPSNVARKTPVTVGYIFRDKVAIVSGLEDVAVVVTEGASYLTDGAAVQVKE